MSTQEVATRDDVELMVDALATQYIAAVKAAESVRVVQDARMRVDMARSALRKWFKTHERAAEAHKNLLRIDAEALARIHQLGGSDKLKSGERQAARFYAAMSDDERDEFVTTWATRSSAVTAYTAARAQEVADEMHRKGVEEGRAAAGGVILPADFTDPTVLPDRSRDGARVYVRGITTALEDALRWRTESGEPFTVEDLAEEVLCSAGAPNPSEYDSVARPNPWRYDSAVREGIHRVFREAVRRHSLTMLGETKLPSFITARIGDGEETGVRFVRVPIGAARLEHLDDAITIRREQIAHDAEAVAELEELARKLRALPGGDDPTVTIGALVAAAAARDDS